MYINDLYYHKETKIGFEKTNSINIGNAIKLTINVVFLYNADNSSILLALNNLLMAGVKKQYSNY